MKSFEVHIIGIIRQDDISHSLASWDFITKALKLCVLITINDFSSTILNSFIINSLITATLSP
jgi:hypothetical protein